MQQQLTPFTLAKAAEIIEAVMIRGDLANLTAEERAKYYVRVCQSVGLNPMTRPFEYIILNGKLTLYTRKDATDQLRALHKVSVTELTETEREGVCIVTAKVSDAEGRTDAAKGAVTITGLKGDALANAIMKAETKAKRRATLSLCGLGLLDETELETIPNSARGPIIASQTRATLPKKDARGTYARLQAEHDAETTSEGIAEWWHASSERRRVLPADWQEILQLRYEETLLAFRQQEGEPVSTRDRMLADISTLSPQEILNWELAHFQDYEDMTTADRDAIDEALKARQNVPVRSKEQIFSDIIGATKGRQIHTDRVQ